MSDDTKELSLEQVQIKWQKSWQFKAVEWLKAIAGIAAILGLFATVFFTSRQLGQLAVSRDEERFDKAVSRLSSQNASERLTGLAGLQLFLESPQKTKHEATLLFLANALALEKDTTVRSAFLDTFNSLKRYGVDQRVLNETAIVERDRNRAILKALRAQFEEKLNKGTAKILDIGNDEVGIGKVSADDLQPLRATASALAALIQAGAQLQDLSEIYCVSCDFSKNGAANLSKVNFDRSYLRNANFTKANLEQSSFDGAYLMHTDFSGAHLRGAKLTDPPLTDPPIQAILWQKALWAAQGPIFECADLTEADFSGSVLFGFYWSSVNGVGYFPRFFGANLSHAKIASFIVFTAWPARMKSKAKGSIKPQFDLLPLRSGQSGQYNISVRGWDEPHNFLTTYSVGQNFQFTGQIRREIWPSVYAGLNSLASAENLGEANLPQGLRDFIAKNPGLSKPVISTNCARFR